MSYSEQHFTDLIIDKVAIPIDGDWFIGEKNAPEQFGRIVRNINGEARYVTGTTSASKPKAVYTWSTSRAYRTPALNGVQRGTQIVVNPVKPWFGWIEAGQLNFTLARAAYLAGSIAIYDDRTNERLADDAWSIAGSTITLAQAHANRLVVQYRPTLTMLVDNYSDSLDEMDAVCGWELSAVEV